MSIWSHYRKWKHPKDHTCLFWEPPHSYLFFSISLKNIALKIPWSQPLNWLLDQLEINSFFLFFFLAFFFKNIIRLLSMEEGLKDCKSWRIRNLLWDCVSSNVRSYTQEVSPTWLPKCELNKNNRNSHAKVDRGRSVRTQLLQRITGNWWAWEVGETVFLREGHPSSLSNIKWSALKTHIQVTLYRQSRLYLGMYMRIYAHM